MKAAEVHESIKNIYLSKNPEIDSVIAPRKSLKVDKKFRIISKTN